MWIAKRPLRFNGVDYVIGDRVPADGERSAYWLESGGWIEKKDDVVEEIVEETKVPENLDHQSDDASVTADDASVTADDASVTADDASVASDDQQSNKESSTLQKSDFHEFKRDELNEYAASIGIENPHQMQNKDAVIDAIVAKTGGA